MTTVGITLPEADDSVKHAVQRMNTAFELGRKTACLPGGGLKEAHQVMLHGIGETQAGIDQEDIMNIPCEESRMVQNVAENMFASYSGTDVPFFDEWKALFLGLEEDVISLMCKDDMADPTKWFDSMDRIVRSSYKSICASDEVLTAMTQEDAVKILAPQIQAMSSATDSAAEKSGVNLEPVKTVIKETVKTVSCPSGLGVFTAHYQIMIGVFCAGLIIAFLLLQRR